MQENTSTRSMELGEQIVAPKLITEHLQHIVDTFNQHFAGWQTATGCVANLKWDYKNGKALGIVSIEMPIYRPEPQDLTSVKEVLAQAEKGA